MFRKAILGLSAAVILGAAIAPSAALAHGGKGKGNGGHHHHKKWHHFEKWSSGYGYGYGGSCWTKAKVWSDYYGDFVWKKVNICY
ncbi:hypothetical protein [Terrihabitans soli]|nr:hypothetical protein [Terrihabitans soli]